jgi:hypothetical protein
MSLDVADHKTAGISLRLPLRSSSSCLLRVRTACDATIPPLLTRFRPTVFTTTCPRTYPPLCFPDAAIAATRKVSATSNKASSRLAAHGIELSESKISVKTDRPPMSREEQVQSSQAAVGAAARYVAERPQAFSVGEER